jgi:HSP20 family molecular chaperone IbpA
MSEEDRKTPVKAIVKGRAAAKSKKPVLAKPVPSEHVPAKRVITTFDDLMEAFRTNFIDSLGSPWELVGVEPVYPIRELTADLVDMGDRFVVRAEMPSVPKDNINIMLTSDGIEISAETDAEREGQDQDFIVRERVYSGVYKVLSFPEEVVPENAESTLKDGLLEVIIPKKTPLPAPKKHKVAVK